MLLNISVGRLLNRNKPVPCQANSMEWKLNLHNNMQKCRRSNSSKYPNYHPITPLWRRKVSCIVGIKFDDPTMYQYLANLLGLPNYYIHHHYQGVNRSSRTPTPPTRHTWFPHTNHKQCHHILCFDLVKSYRTFLWTDPYNGHIQ